MKTLTKFVAVAGVATLALTACSSGQKASSESSSAAASKGASFKACAVSDAGLEACALRCCGGARF